MKHRRDQFDTLLEGNYRNYMQTKVVRVGNSKGVRIPKIVLETYRLDTGDELSIEQQSDGILLRPIRTEGTIPRAEAYAEMAAEQAETDEWSEWDSVSGDEA
jgi:antitoxin MazE